MKQALTLQQMEDALREYGYEIRYENGLCTVFDPRLDSDGFYLSDKSRRYVLSEAYQHQISDSMPPQDDA